jgi:hypothetical protein
MGRWRKFSKEAVLFVNKKVTPKPSKNKKISKNKQFFFEACRRPDSDYAAKRPLRHRDARTKKPLRRDAKVVARPLAKNYQSFFASFCSQKEVLSFFIAF